MKYMLLAPSDSFRDIAEESRSVILAGGTMAPVSGHTRSLDVVLTTLSSADE
jgi:chromosome transmission fidelity protein 1